MHISWNLFSSILLNSIKVIWLNFFLNLLKVYECHQILLNSLKFLYILPNFTELVKIYLEF